MNSTGNRLTRACQVADCPAEHTTLFIARLAGTLSQYMVLCRTHAKSHRALGYELRAVRRSKGMY